MGGVCVDTKVLLKEMLRAIWIHTVVSWHQPELAKNHYTAETLLTENTPRKQLGTVCVLFLFVTATVHKAEGRAELCESVLSRYTSKGLFAFGQMLWWLHSHDFAVAYILGLILWSGDRHENVNTFLMFRWMGLSSWWSEGGEVLSVIVVFMFSILSCDIIWLARVINKVNVLYYV